MLPYQAPHLLEAIMLGLAKECVIKIIRGHGGKNSVVFVRLLNNYPA
jgi:hypothetical protein